MLRENGRGALNRVHHASQLAGFGPVHAPSGRNGAKSWLVWLFCDGASDALGLRLTNRLLGPVGVTG